jgi:hypothetical protein
MTVAAFAPPALKIRERERQAILSSLRAGVVPKVGLQHIQVGRKVEVEAVLKDLGVVGAGGAAIRFVIGRFGSGKSFFLNLASTVAIEKGFLVARADVTTDRRLHGTGGQARALFSELMRNLSSRSKPDGGALGPVIEKWISGVVQSAPAETDVPKAIESALRPVQDLVSGFDFATVLTRYFQAYGAGDGKTQQNVIRWLRAEYDTKTEAKEDLGVRSIIADADLYDYLKVLAKFARIAGYQGLVVAIDEMVVLSHRLASTRARASNFEAILRILNDCLQGNVEGLQVLFGGTDEFLEDRRRGLYSYEALATRLAANEFAKEGIVDLSGPVIRLKSLTPEDLYVLLHRIRDVFASGDSSKYLVPDEGLRAYVDYSRRTLGDDYFRTPRDTVTRFVGLMNILEAEPAHDWRAALGHVSDVEVKPSLSAEASAAVTPEDDDLTTFKL